MLSYSHILQASHSRIAAYAAGAENDHINGKQHKNTVFASISR
jgi:hypothetical protein